MLTTYIHTKDACSDVKRLTRRQKIKDIHSERTKNAQSPSLCSSHRNGQPFLFFLPPNYSRLLIVELKFGLISATAGCTSTATHRAIKLHWSHNTSMLEAQSFNKMQGHEMTRALCSTCTTSTNTRRNKGPCRLYYLRRQICRFICLVLLEPTMYYMYANATSRRCMYFITHQQGRIMSQNNVALAA